MAPAARSGTGMKVTIILAAVLFRSKFEE